MESLEFPFSLRLARPFVTLFSEASRHNTLHTPACQHSALTEMMMSPEKMNVILQWLRAKDTVWDERMCAAAAADGELDVLKWLRELGCPWDETTSKSAREGGHLEVLQWAHTSGCPWHLSVGTNRVEVLGFKLEELEAFPVPVEVVVTHILGSDNLPNPADLARLRAVNHAMRDAVEATGREIKELNFESTVALGCLSVVQRLHRQGRLEKRVVCECAAKYGHLEVLQWARANGCPWDSITCSWAAEGGHLKVLQWAHTNGCPWSAGTCAYAAEKGHLEVLQWARANGCPCDIRTRQFARGDTLEWAIANGAP